ncbi:myosin-binding protein 1-like [Impatiens glandulifera]|uniref:myosin-binding protein 1-like n=1 Tax=Impatiens glandulifera TaxID=253017 RepID=UPI001FB08262|nr:myosin-binding protein 1-like [Impatiens glandulifera]
MATKDTSFVQSQSQEGRQDIISALSSAVFEWLLMFMLFIDSCFSHLIMRFAAYCKLHLPCLICSRLDHVFGNAKHKFYWDMICGNHKQEISSLVFCRVHNKLGDVNGMCENCLFSFATIDKSNAETYRLLVGKMGAGDEFDDDPSFADREYGLSRCSCCNGVWTKKIHTASPHLSAKSARLDHTELDALLSVGSEYDLKRKKIGEETSSRSFKAPLKMRNNSFDPPLYDVGYTKVKITSDSESEDTIHENGDDEHQNINFDHDLGLERLINLDSLSKLDKMVDSEYGLKKKKTLKETTSRSFEAPLMMRKNSFDTPLYDSGYTKVKITSDTESEDLIHENGDDEHQTVNFDHDLGLERLIPLDSFSELDEMVDSQVVLVNVDNSVSAVGHGLEELNWSQVEQKRYEESSTKKWKHFDEKWPSSDIIAILCQEEVTTTTSTLEQKVDNEDGVVSEIETSPKMNHVAGDVEQNSGDSLMVNIETSERSIIGSETSQLFPNDLELGDAYKLAVANKSRQLSGKFLQQISQKESTRLSEDLKLLLSQMTSNRGSELPPYDMSPRVSVVSRISLERNESGLSLDGSVVGEIEGENEIDRLKRQAEYDKKIMNALYKELEEERNASAVAANQAMAMITKLQEEKAAVHMEALQCIRVMEEQAEYDVEALHKTNELLTDKEKEVQDLEEEVEYYRIKFGDVSMMEDDELRLASDDVIIPGQERLYILQNLRKLENKLVLLSHDDGIEENSSDNFRSFSMGVGSRNSTGIDVSLVDDISSLIRRLEMESLKGTHSSLETSVSSFCRRDEALKVHPDDGFTDDE